MREKHGFKFTEEGEEKKPIVIDYDFVNGTWVSIEKEAEELIETIEIVPEGGKVESVEVVKEKKPSPKKSKKAKKA